MAIYDQEGFDARFDWGTDGARELSRNAKTVVVVDVLSFTTAVETGVTRGARLYPLAWRGTRGPQPEALARRIGGVAAVRRHETSPRRPFSLSPPSMMHARPGLRIVVSSPNGAEVSLAAAESAATVLAGCLRNAGAVARAALAIGGPIAVIAAGERWRRSRTLRPSLEDLVGAGAILDALEGASLSPEAAAAAAAYRGIAVDLMGAISQCSSARELSASGFGGDVAWAAEHDVSEAVPILRARAFTRRES
ncbi:MAG TPA: 2-phosphosulfolactate phosphatase [Candidatus Binataceae bacterium]|nr:2-phosphosulfolactate phosphatase [Candidatus Binataceae bacterium]